MQRCAASGTRRVHTPFACGRPARNGWVSNSRDRKRYRQLQGRFRSRVPWIAARRRRWQARGMSFPARPRCSRRTPIPTLRAASPRFGPPSSGMISCETFCAVVLGALPRRASAQHWRSRQGQTIALLLGLGPFSIVEALFTGLWTLHGKEDALCAHIAFQFCYGL